jgi:hypothetical protein
MCHDMAFELIQVRAGPSTGMPTMRGIQHCGSDVGAADEMADIWTRMRGEEGKQKRAKAKEMRDRILWSRERGPTRDIFLDFICAIKGSA